MKEQLILLPPEEYALRVNRLHHAMEMAGIGAILVGDNANLLHLCGRVFTGYAYVSVDDAPVWFVRRPVELEGAGVVYIRKPEDIPAALAEAGLRVPQSFGLELDLLSYNEAMRLRKVFESCRVADSTPLLRGLRAVKTPYEIALMRQSGYKHEQVYRKIPGLYQPGMTDLELQVEIERISRLEGCLGMFRISGQSMEIFMGNVLTGANADVPTPYDFAMGGRGLDPSIPVGACGEEIKEHQAVMVDLNGDYTGYMTDMTRVFSLGTLPQKAMEAHRCSIEICHMFEREARPGVEARTLYDMAADMARGCGLEHRFMGHRQHAGFVGHGVGIEVNEWPVIAPRSKQVIEENNTIALEPKFVIPGVGAVGIENTYHITAEGAISLTNAPEEIVRFR